MLTTTSTAGSSEGIARRSAADRRLRDVLDTHARFTMRLLRRFGVTGAAAEDAAQLVAMVVARRLPELPRGTERQFLSGVARRVAWTTRRAAQRTCEAFDYDLETIFDDGLDPEHELELQRARTLVARVLEQMPAALREVFVLHDLDGMSMCDVASALAIPAGTVASRLRRARCHLQAETAHFRGSSASFTHGRGGGERDGTRPSA